LKRSASELKTFPKRRSRLNPATAKIDREGQNRV
jgi:hypothetical protein